MRCLAGLISAIVLFAAPTVAQEVMITPSMSSKQVTINGATITIAREQNPDAVIPDEYAKTARACPPFCIHPMSAGDGVETIGELELLDFLETNVAAGRGLLIDSRLPEWFEKGTIPGAINVPFATVEETNPYRDQILEALGAVKTGDGWDYAGAMELALFCNGAWCDQSSRAINSLMAVGYPADKLKYYRGGMQSWTSLGLTVKQP